MGELVKVIRHSLAVFLVLIALAGVMGKKLLSQMTFAEFVIGISMGTIAGAFVIKPCRRQ